MFEPGVALTTPAPAKAALYSIYLMESESSWYVGSAWNNSASVRYRQHHAGLGGARTLWDAIQSGESFSQRILESGYATLHLTHWAEEAWIADFYINDLRKCLNVNLWPTRYPAHAGIGVPKPAVSERMRNPEIQATLAGIRANRSDEEKAASIAKRTATMQENKTHCRQGHEFTPENTYTPPSHPNERNCRTCMNAWRKPKAATTHCSRGHEFTLENTIVGPKGRRNCRTCREQRRRLVHVS